MKTKFNWKWLALAGAVLLMLAFLTPLVVVQVAKAFTAREQAARTDCTASLRQAGADCQRKAQLEADRQAHTRQRPALEQQVQEADRTAAAQSARVQALEQQVLAKQKALPYPQRAQAQAALDLLEADRTALRAMMREHPEKRERVDFPR